jgi:hypothetical protein
VLVEGFVFGEGVQEGGARGYCAGVGGFVEGFEVFFGGGEATCERNM